MKRITFILAVLCTFGVVGLLRAESDAGVKGAEGGAATFYLYADQGDDDADKAYIQMGADGTFVFNIDGTNVITMTSAGALAVVGDQAFAGTIDADAITVNAAAGIDTKTAGKLVVGAATATSLDLGASDITTTISGTTVASGALWLGTNGYFQVSGGALQFVGHNSCTNEIDADITQ